MAAPVRVEAMAFSDPRIELLGQLGGFSRYEALGRMTYLWSACTERQLHVVPESVIRGCIGPDGVRLLLEADLAEEVEGGYRVRGTDGRIEWRGNYAETKSAAGKARAATAKRNSKGQMLPKGAVQHEPADVQHADPGEPADQHESSTNPARAGSAGPAQPSTSQQTASTTPAESSALTRSQDLSLPRARERHPEAGRVARAIWNRAAVVHSELRPIVDPTAQPWSAVPSASSKGWDLLLDRACELLVGGTADDAIERGKHAIEVTAAEARTKGTLEYFIAPRMFRPDSFEIALSLSPEQVARRAGGTNTNKPAPKFAVIPSPHVQRKEAS